MNMLPWKGSQSYWDGRDTHHQSPQRIPPKPSEVVALLCLGDEVENPEFLTMDLESRSDDAISCGQLASPPRYTRVYRKLGIVSLVLAQRRVLNEKVR